MVLLCKHDIRNFKSLIQFESLIQFYIGFTILLLHLGTTGFFMVCFESYQHLTYPKEIVTISKTVKPMI